LLAASVAALAASSASDAVASVGDSSVRVTGTSVPARVDTKFVSAVASVPVSVNVTIAEAAETVAPVAARVATPFAKLTC